MGNNALVKQSKFHGLKKMGLSVMVTLCTASMCITQCFADTSAGADAGLTQFNNVIDVLATWIGRIGLVIGFIGAIQFAMGIKDSDADSKSKGLMTLASGFVVFGLCTAYSTFFSN
jgi:hypothetical protein